MPGDDHDHLALRRSRSALWHMRYGDVQGKLPLCWPAAGVYGSGYWPTMQQLGFGLWGNSECPGLRLNHGERVPHECVLSAAVSVGGNRVGAASTPRYGATGGVVDALRTGSGRIPPLKGLSSRTGVRPFGASPTTTTTLPCLICFFTIADQCLGPCSGGVDL